MVRFYATECGVDVVEAASCALVNGMIIQTSFASNNYGSAREAAVKYILRMMDEGAIVVFNLTKDITAEVDYYPLDLPGEVYGLCMSIYVGDVCLGRAEDVVVRGDRLYILLPGLTMEFNQRGLADEFDKQCTLYRASHELKMKPKEVEDVGPTGELESLEGDPQVDAEEM